MLFFNDDCMMAIAQWQVRQTKGCEWDEWSATTMKCHDARSAAKAENQVRKLVTGSGAAICDECIELCVDIISEERVKDAQLNTLQLPKPAQISAYLDNYVVGQESAKERFPWPYTTITSASIWKCANPRHCAIVRRMRATIHWPACRCPKSNILLLGADRRGQNVSCADAGEGHECAVRHRRRHHTH